MTRSEILQKFAKIVRDFTHVETPMTESLSLTDDYGIDSLDAVELAIVIETEFNIDIEVTEDYVLGETVKDVLDLIEAKKR